MTKGEYQAAQKEAPVGTAGILRIREIVANNSYGNINCIGVDLFSASAVIRVYDAVNDANKIKLKALPVLRLVSVCFKILNKR